MYKKSKRFLAGFLAFLLAVTMLPTDMLSVVYAEETQTIEAQTLEPQEAEQDSDAAALEDTNDESNLAAAADDDAVDDTEKTDDDTAVDTEKTDDDTADDTEKTDDDMLNEDNKEDKENNEALAASEAEVVSEKVEDVDISDVEDTASARNEDLKSTMTYKLDESTFVADKISAPITTLVTDIDTNGYFDAVGGVVTTSEKTTTKAVKIQSCKEGSITISDYGSDFTEDTVVIGLTAGGVGNKDDNNDYFPGIRFKTNAANATVKVLSSGRKGKNNDGTDKAGAKVVIKDSTGADVATGTACDAEYDKIYTDNFTLASPGTYYIGFNSQGGVIFSIEVTDKLELGFKENPSFTSTGNPKTPFIDDTLTVDFTPNDDEKRTPVIKWYKVSSDNQEPELTADDADDDNEGKSYTITADDEGSKIKAVVTFEAEGGKEKVEESCITEAAVTGKKFGFKTSPSFNREADDVLHPGETLTLTYELNETGTDNSDIKWELVTTENGTEKTTDLTADENSNNRAYTVQTTDIGGKIRATVTPKLADDKTGEAEKAETITVTAIPVLYNMHLNVSDLAIAQYTESFSKSGFTINAAVDEEEVRKSVTVDENTKTPYTRRLKTSGPGTKDYRSINFDVSDNATIKIACMSGNSKIKSYLGIATLQNDELKECTGYDYSLDDATTTSKYQTGGIAVDGSGLHTVTVKAEKGGTYYLYTTLQMDGTSIPGINFYAIDVTYENGLEHTAFTVTFDTKGGVAIGTQSVQAGETCAEPVSYKDGYDLAGWCTDSACTQDYDFASAVTADITLYAKWVESTQRGENLELDMKDLPVMGYKETFTKNGFTINASNDKNVSIAKRTVIMDDSRIYTQALQLNGTGDDTSRNISFTTTKESTVTIVAETTSGNVRTLALNENSVVTDGSVELSYSQSIDGVYEWIEEDVPAGTWYVYSTNSGINIYYILVEEKEDGGDISDGDYTISFKDNDGADLGIKDKKITGTTLDLSEIDQPSKSGYIFMGWSRTQGESEEDYIPTQAIFIDSDTVLYAVWQKEITVTFMNGDNVFHEKKNIMPNSLYTLSELLEGADMEKLTPPDDHQKFAGWADSKDSKELLDLNTYPRLDRDRTYYAVFIAEDAKVYTVTYEDEYGEPWDTLSVLEGGIITFGDYCGEGKDEVRYIFKGWKEKGSTDDKVYKPDDGESTPDTYTVTKDVTFVEVWEERPPEKCTITLADEDGKTLKTEQVEEGKEYILPGPQSEKGANSFFVGWYSDWDSETYPQGGKCKIWSDTTFTEIWTTEAKAEYTVKFMAGGEEITSLAKTIKVGDSPVITMPEPVSKKIGYAFEGWEDSVNWNTYKTGASYTVTENVVFYEGWSEDWYDRGMYIWMNGDDTYYHGGAAVTPQIYVCYNDEYLTPGKDYTVKYKNNKNAGTATLTVTGKNNFAKAKKDAEFTIRKADLEELDYVGAMTVVKNAKVTPVIMQNGKQLKLGKDYELSGEGLNNKGQYTEVTKTDEKTQAPIPNKLTVTGINNYTGKLTIDVVVVERGTGLAVEVDKNFKPVVGAKELYYDLFKDTMDGNEKVKRKITVYEKGDANKKALEPGTDFQVLYVSGSPYSAGTVKFMVVGMGKYSGNVTKSFKISPKPLADSDIKIEAYCRKESDNGGYTYYDWVDKNFNADYSSTGSTLDLWISYKTGTESNANDYNGSLSEGVDYKVSYSGNKKVGTAKAKITFINDYKGTKPKTVEFKITGVPITYADAVVPDMVYTKAGKSYVSKPIVQYDSAIVKASEYTVSYRWSSASDMNKTTGERSWTTDNNNKVNIELNDGDTYAVVEATIRPKDGKSNFILSKDANGVDLPLIRYYYVKKADENNTDISKAKVEFFADNVKNAKGEWELENQYKKIPYCGSPFYTPEGNKVSYAEGDRTVYVRVTVGNDIIDASLYDVEWFNAKNKGKATVVIKGKAPEDTAAEAKPVKSVAGSKTATIAIDSIGQWVEPSRWEEDYTLKNFLKKLF